MEKVKHLKIPLKEIELATNNFNNIENFIAAGGFGKVYKGSLLSSDDQNQIPIAVKRLDPNLGQGEHEFFMEISMLSSYKHKNLATLVGYCDDGGEKILVYVHESRGSLDKYIHNPDLTWVQRLQISIGAARGLNYLHDEVGSQHRVLHRDIKSSNILLNDEWEAKVSDFGLSRIGPANMDMTLVFTNARGTHGYVDPVYDETRLLTKESDVYSFGVVLFELLCGRMAYERVKTKDGPMFLASLARLHYDENKLEEIINPNLRKQMELNSLNTFSAIAYQCVKPSQSDRPTMREILGKLEKALKLQNGVDAPEVARVGLWGNKSSGDLQNHWSFLLEEDHKLRMITIDHGDMIYSLMFTTESKGHLNPFPKVGGSSGAEISEITFAHNEEIIGIEGTVWVSGPYTMISSLAFVSNKRRTHGPFGRAIGTPFSVPWEEGSFGGFYGISGFYIHAIGVYLKASI